MVTEGFKRKITTIFSADVAGYSRLMSEDEAETVKTLTAYRGIMAELIKQHRGRVLDSPGDNLLAEFTSVVGAGIIAAGEREAREKGLEDVQSTVVQGDPAEEIINFARDEGVDMIMIGSREWVRSRGCFSGAFPARSAMWLTAPV